MDNIIMPHNKDAEKSLIATCLYSPEDAVEVCDLLKPDDFYTGLYEKIFTVICKLVAQDKLPTLDLVADKLGTVEYAVTLSDIYDNHPIAPNIESHCDLVIGYRIKRDAIKQAYAVIKRAQGNDDAQDVLDYIETSFGGLAPCTNKDAVPVCELSDQAIERIEKLNKSKNLITGITTGYRKLDYLTCGLQNSDLTILAARPSIGKTALALNIQQNAAEKSNVASAIYSLEMSKEQLYMRLITSKSRVNAQQTRTGNVPRNLWPRLMDSFGIVDEWPILINDTASTLGQIRRSARNLKRKRRLGFIVIDYLQLIKVPNLMSRNYEIGDISRGLKLLAKELDIPILALSQLNRKLEERSNKRPQLADLRDSGSLEQDADNIWFLYRDYVYSKDKDKLRDAELDVAKQRSGPTGTVPLTFFGEYTRFENYSPEMGGL